MSHLFNFFNNGTSGGGGGGGVPTGRLELDINPAIGAFQDIQQNTPCTNNTAVESLQNQGDNFMFLQSTGSRKPTWLAASSAQNNKPYLLFDEDYMISASGTPLFTLRSQDCTFYAVVKSVSSANTWDTLLEKNTNWQWDDGWRLATDNQEDWVTNVGGGGQSENRIDNTNTSTSQAEIYTLRFRASTTPYINSTFSTWSIGYTVTGTTTGFASKSTPARQIIFGTSNNSGGDGVSSFRWNGQVFRILGYSECHSESTLQSTIATLKTIYGI